MKIVTMKKVPDITQMGEDVLVAPSSYAFVVADDADNQYEIPTDRDTYETLCTVSKAIYDVAQSVPGVN